MTSLFKVSKVSEVREVSEVNEVREVREVREESEASNLLKKVENNEIDTNLWQTDYEESDIKTCERILNEIKPTELEKRDLNDIKNDYNNSNNKSEFIKSFLETWFKERAGTLIKKDRSITKDEVKLKRFKFLLLEGYIINCNPGNKEYLKKYRQICYQRLVTLHDLLGNKILELPMPTTFFAKHS
ncbi:2164_t:CDS:2, partial [Dentiscutata erythropus]